MTDQSVPETPIVVEEKTSNVVMSESTKLILMAAFAVAAAHFIQSESALGMVMAASGVIVTWGYGVYRRLRNWSIMKNLTTFVDDSVARIGHPK